MDEERAVDAHIEAQREIRSREDQGWARWLSRSLDLFAGLAVLVVVGFAAAILWLVGVKIAGWTLPAFPDWLTAAYADPTANTIIDSAVGVLLLIVLEAIYLSLFGTTPGKWVMGIRVLKLDGKRLNIAAAFGRAFGAHGLGIAFGIPVLNLIAAAINRGQLLSDGKTIWESYSGGLTHHRKRPVALWWLMIPLVICGNIAIVLLTRMTG